MQVRLVLPAAENVRMAEDMRGLLEVYEARGDEAAFVRARSLYERAVAGAPDPTVVLEYGYLLECHGRYSLRQAVLQYERAIALDPDADKPRYQLIFARAALGEADQEITRYRQRLAASPGDVREHRLLAAAHLAARDYAQAGRVVDAGLELAGEDRALIEYRGDVRAATGDPDGALADWRHALDLDPENISALYSSAFLFERENRLDESMAAWRGIRDWGEARGYTLDTEWPTRELDRLRQKAPPTVTPVSCAVARGRP
jgi:tetratricopeptide (TPR) repeat protein